MRREIWLITCACIISVMYPGSEGKHIPSFAGPFKVVVRKWIANSSNQVYVALRHSHYKPGQDQYFWGNVYHSIPLDDTMKLDIDVAIWANNQWKRNAFVIRMVNACSEFVKRFGTMSVWLHGEEGRRCPIRKGTWTVKNQTYDIQFPDVKVFPYGRYLNEYTWRKNNRYVGITHSEVDIIPRL